MRGAEMDARRDGAQRDVVAGGDGAGEARGGGFVPAAGRAGSVGVTLFDTPASDDATVTVVLPPDQLERVPNRAFVRIAGDGAGGQAPRSYVGLVAAGPF